MGPYWLVFFLEWKRNTEWGPHQGEIGLSAWRFNNCWQGKCSPRKRKRIKGFMEKGKKRFFKGQNGSYGLAEKASRNNNGFYRQQQAQRVGAILRLL